MIMDEIREILYKERNKLNVALDCAKRELKYDENFTIISKFVDKCIGDSLEFNTIYQRVYILKGLEKFVDKVFSFVTKEDVIKLNVEIELSDFSEGTKLGYKITYKKFFEWLGLNDVSSEIKTRNNYKRLKKQPRKPILTAEERKRLIQAASNTRDRALISMLSELTVTFRGGEFRSMKIKDCVPDSYGGFILHINFSKTRIRSNISHLFAKNLSCWLNEHPLSNNPEAFLWMPLSGENRPLSSVRIWAIFKCAQKKAGIEKNVSPHAFRRTSGTELSFYLNPFDLCETMGLIQGSPALANYVLPPEKKIQNEIYTKVLRINTEENNGKSLEPSLSFKICYNCKKENVPTNIYCEICNAPLNKKALIELIEKNINRETIEMILENKQSRKILEDLLKRHKFENDNNSIISS